MAVSEQRFAGTDKKFFTVQKKGGINTQSPRESIKDSEFSWLENMQPIADGNFRSLYSNGASIYTAAATIIYFYPFNVGAVQYMAVFLSNGTAVSINVVSQAVTTISSNPGTFYPGDGSLGSPAPQCAQFGQGGIVIVATTGPNSYWAWDGMTLTYPGQAAPSWLTNNVATSMPSGVSGTCVEIYQSRVWVGKGAVIQFSAPSNGADFSVADGACAFHSQDSFLRREFTALRQTNGFLYLFADSSINVISNVQTGGSPVLTTFNNANVDPQVGTSWHNGVVAFGKGLVFGNAEGVFLLRSSEAQKVSDNLNGIFLTARQTLSQVMVITQPSAASMTVNDIVLYMLLVPVQGPFDSSLRNAVVMWDEKDWWVGSQVSSLTFINTQEINSILYAWGTDGTHLFPLFTTPSASLTKIWQTKQWAGEGPHITKQAMRLYTKAIDNFGGGYNFTGTMDTILENAAPFSQSFSITSLSYLITWLNNSNGIIQWQNNSNQNVNFAVAGETLTGTGSIAANSRGNYMGMTLQSTSADFTLIMHELLYQEQSPLGA